MIIYYKRYAGVVQSEQWSSVVLFSAGMEAVPGVLLRREEGWMFIDQEVKECSGGDCG